MSPSYKEATEQSLKFVNAWRPVFRLLVHSREFRKLIVDSIRIIKRVTNRYIGDDVVSQVREQWVEGHETKTILKTASEQLKHKGEESQMTEIEWEVLKNEITEVLVVLAREPSYHEGLDNLFSLFDLFKLSFSSVSEASVQKVEPHARKAQKETEELVVSFTKREPLKRFKRYLRNLVVTIQENPEFAQYLSEVREFILSSKSEEYVASDDFKRRSKELSYRGRHEMRNFKNEVDLDHFLDAANDLIVNIKNDEFVKILRQQAGILSADLSYVDDEGVTRVDTDMLVKLQSVLLPVLAENLKYIPVPRLESKDTNREFTLDNITICGYDILPENIKFNLESETELSLRDIETKNMNTRLIITLDKLRTEVKDMDFYFKKKTFPELSDRGRVTFRIRGDGANLKLTFRVVKDEDMRRTRLTEGFANFHIGEMDIEFDKSTIKHDILLPMMSSLFKQHIIQKIESSVEKNLNGLVQNLGRRLTDTMVEAGRPLNTSIDTARKVLKGTEISHVYEKRREKLE
jgi:hypothetical protein